MADLNKIKPTRERDLDTSFVALCKSIDAKRPRTVIDHILKHGIITTEELNDTYGYDHPPRAIRDVRENGIPLITHNVISPKSGRRMGAYTFDDISKIRKGRIGGRKAFPKKFRQELLTFYGSKDAITGDKLEGRYLQIDHRIPYEIAGEGDGILNSKDFMLLDASSNRAKSWSCEHCTNFINKRDAAICGRCFWASPDNYDHIAERASRRVDILWSGDEVAQFDTLKQEAIDAGIDLIALIKKKLGE